MGWPITSASVNPNSAVAALFQDRIFPSASPDMIASIADSDRLSDAKSQLQEWVQNSGNPPPAYSMVEEIGPDHDKRFRVRVEAGGREQVGSGRRIKEAEKDAARKLLQRLKTADPGP